MTNAATSLLMAAALAAASTTSASAQPVSPGPVVAAGNAVLTISADGRSTRTPDLAVFSAGVTTQAKTAAAALAENAERMNAVIAALKASGIAERDIQTSNLSVNPVYGQPRTDSNGNVTGEPVIIGYQAEGSLGRRLVDGANRVRLFGEDVPVRARIHTIGGLSAHADRTALLGWLGAFKQPPARTFVVHGEDLIAQDFAKLVTERLRWPRVDAPFQGSHYQL